MDGDEKEKGGREGGGRERGGVCVGGESSCSAIKFFPK